VRSFPIIIIGAVASASLIAGCGSSSDDTSATTEAGAATTSAASPATTASSATEEGPTISVDGVTVSGPKGEQPTVTVTPGTPAPTSLVVEDVYVGDGAEIGPGGAGTFNYEGVLFSDGVMFDSSWERGQPISFSLDQVIPGWQEGIVGMKAGGRRLLIVPPDLAYGNRALAGIPPNSTLVFVVDLDAVR